MATSENAKRNMGAGLNQFNLPDSVFVQISQVKGGFVANLSEYDVFTEADSLIELDYMINDLILCYFDVPESIRKLVKYTRAPEKPKEISDVEKIVYLKYYAPDARYLFP